MGRMVISTRLFCARPSSVVFGASGSCHPSRPAGNAPPQIPWPPGSSALLRPHFDGPGYMPRCPWHRHARPARLATSGSPAALAPRSPAPAAPLASGWLCRSRRRPAPASPAIPRAGLLLSGGRAVGAATAIVHCKPDGVVPRPSILMGSSRGGGAGCCSVAKVPSIGQLIAIRSLDPSPESLSAVLTSPSAGAASLARGGRFAGAGGAATTGCGRGLVSAIISCASREASSDLQE